MDFIWGDFIAAWCDQHNTTSLQEFGKADKAMMDDIRYKRITTDPEHFEGHMLLLKLKGAKQSDTWLWNFHDSSSGCNSSRIPSTHIVDTKKKARQHKKLNKAFSGPLIMILSGSESLLHCSTLWTCGYDFKHIEPYSLWQWPEIKTVQHKYIYRIEHSAKGAKIDISCQTVGWIILSFANCISETMPSR
jgi:hypothetical protein